MSAFKDTLNHTGYSQEELYFHRVNQELIEKMKMDGKRVVQKKHLTLISSDHKEQLHETSPPVKAQDAVKKAA
jgi:hypothetical protein